ncbi:MAG: glycosyltransferase [Phycisphaerales bacterium]|nr:glycosyltransferase [Phycisphaerales bacterium]
MRIALVNWAMIWDGAVKGGGVNGYCQSLALELVERGHEVIYLSGGLTFTPVTITGSAQGSASAPDQAGPCQIRRHPDWLGIRIFEIINSPVVAPSLHQLQEPAGEIASADLERTITEFFQALRPDIVHFHNIEGFTASCVSAARVARDNGEPSRVFYSIHNYHTVCPQVYLMQGHRRPCFDFRNGHACVNCIPTSPPADEKQRRMDEYIAALPAGLAAPLAAPLPVAPTPPPMPVPVPVPEPRSPILRQLGSEIRSLVMGTPQRASEQSKTTPPSEPAQPEPAVHQVAVPLPGVTAITAGQLADAQPLPGADARGQTAFILAERNQPHKFGPGDPEWAPLGNHAIADPRSERAPNEYAARRAAMIQMLNGCDGVLAVSEFVRKKFEALGVRPEVIRTNHIGTRLNRVARMHRDVIFDPPPFDRANPRPVRLVFIGFNNWYKGLPMLADSLELMPAHELGRLHISIYGLGVGADEWRFRRMEPRLGALTIHPMYAYYDIPWILGGKDLGIVPSVWWDNAPQTVFEFFACGVPVLGADLGGIPDFVREGVNGMLFRGNDRYDLAHRLGEIVREPWKLFDLRRNVSPPKDIGDHAAELERLYGGGLGALAGDPDRQAVVVPAGVGSVGRPDRATGSVGGVG